MTLTSTIILALAWLALTCWAGSHVGQAMKRGGK
jgi:hypothetical protein